MSEKEAEKTITAEEFKCKFALPKEHFPEVGVFSNAIGIYAKKVYPDGNASSYGVEIARHKPQPTSRKSLFAHVAYRRNSSDGIFLIDNKLSDHINLNFDDEFFYDLNTDKFYYKDKEILPEGIFSIIDEAHKKPTKPIRGFPLRSKLWFWRKFLPKTIKYLDILLIGLLWIISGERIKGDIWKRIIGIYSDKKFQIEEKQNLFEEPKTMEFFGYKAKRWSVVFYCLLHLTTFSFFYWKSIEYAFVTETLGNNFLALCYVVVSFALTESLVPRIIKSTIHEITPKMFINVSDKKLSVS